MTTPDARLTIDRIPAPKDAPFKAVLAVVDDDHLCALDFEGFETRMHRLLQRRYGRYGLVDMDDPAGVATRMRAYFRGELGALDDIRVKPGGTEFQAAAWRALREIPKGRTATYAEQARRVGRPTAVRAIGAANGQNPVAIVLPCHRVVGAGGALTGYAGGLAAKQWLLAHEARHAAGS